MPKPTRKNPAASASRPLLGPVVAFAIADGALPKRVKIADWGANVCRSVEGIGKDRAVIVNEVTVAALPVMQSKIGFDLVALDFEHQTHKGSANYTPPPHNVAGHGRIEVVAGEGIFYIAQDYTPSGIKHAADYPDLSGVFWPNAKGEVVAVSSVALCQQGSVEGIHFKEAELTALAASIAASMGDMEMGGMDDCDRVCALARQFLGFDETATDADIATALEAMLRQKARDAEARAQQEALTAQRNSPSNKPTQTTMDTETQKAIDSLAASVKVIADGQATVIKSIEERAAKDAIAAHNAAVESVIAASVQAGKVIPATLKVQDGTGRYLLDATRAKEILDCIPATVNTEFDGTQAKPGAGADSPTSIDKEVCAALNIDAAAFAKGGIPRAHEPAPSGVKVA